MVTFFKVRAAFSRTAGKCGTWGPPSRGACDFRPMQVDLSPYRWRRYQAIFDT